MSYMECDAATNKFPNPQSVGNEYSVNKLLQCVTFIGRLQNFETEIVIHSGSGIPLLSLELHNLTNKYSCKPLDVFSNSVLVKIVAGEGLDIVGSTTA